MYFYVISYLQNQGSNKLVRANRMYVVPGALSDNYFLPQPTWITGDSYKLVASWVYSTNAITTYTQLKKLRNLDRLFKTPKCTRVRTDDPAVDQ